MKKTIFALALFAFSLAAKAQTAAREFTVKVSDDGRATMICSLPDPQKATGRAVVICPGGAYWIVSTKLEGTGFTPFFNSLGIATFVLNYRLPHGDRTIPISDAMRAMKMVRDSAATWGVNPNDVGIMGSSAGGHLASYVATHADIAHRPNFQILFYPVISMEPRGTHGGTARNLLGRQGEKDRKLIDEYSSDKNVHPHITPPALLLLADDDESVPPITNAVAYYTAMRRSGNECTMHIYPSGGHGFGSNPNFRYHEQMLRDLKDWLEQLYAPDKDAIRVACIGNSITDGATIDLKDRYGYPAQMQRLLGPKYYVRNYGVSARTLMQTGNLPYMNEPQWKEALAFCPDIAIIKLGTNDSKPANWAHHDGFKADLQTMIDSLRALPSKPKIYLVLPLVATNKCQKEWDIDNQVIENDIIPIIKKVAKKNHLPLIDIREALNKKELMSPDGIHPNRKGAAEMARLIAEELGVGR